MKKWIIFTALIVFWGFSSIGNVFAGPPLVNLEGVGGIAFNPLAYPADSTGDNSHFKVGGIDILGKPRFGAWYVSLDEVNVDWTAIGIAETLFNRLEISYGYEAIAHSKNPTIHKNNIGAKLLLVPENALNLNFIPAVSVGTIYKHASDVGDKIDDDSFDYYAVVTKLITQLPVPLLLSGGVLSTKGLVTGVFGFDKDREVTGFGNIDVILAKQFVLGFEYKQGARFSDFKNADYWDAHLAWLATDKLTLVAAYVDAGDSESKDKVGLGDGAVLSAQYAF